MSCFNLISFGRECGEDGELCDDCAEKVLREHAYLANVPKYAVMPEDDGYFALLRDAGRVA